jgi:integrase
MAAKIRDAKLDTPTARQKLTPRGKPYYRAIGEGLHLGYRKGKSDGKWVARVYAGDGNYVLETMATADDRADPDGQDVLSFYQAQDRAREVHKRLTGKGEARGPYTVADAMTDYVAALRHAGKPTADPLYRINAHILPALGKVEVATLAKKKIEAWHKALSETPPRIRSKRDATEVRHRELADDEEAVRRRRASSNRTLTVLKAALNVAWADKDIPVFDDQAWRSVKPFKKVEKARGGYLEVAEAKRLVNACEPGFRKLVQAALQTGARYGELARLRVEDFNRDVGTLHVRQSKSGKPRHVYLTDEGAAFFRQLCVGRSGGALLLPNEARLGRSIERAEIERKRRQDRGDKTPVVMDDAGEWRASEQIREMNRACERAKIDPPISFHGLRHTWASLAIMGGVPLLVVSRNLGHKDTRMCELHYGHLAAGYVRDAIKEGAPKFGTVEPTNVQALV